MASRRELAAALLERSGLGALARRSWRGLVVLNHHRVGEPDGLPAEPGLWSATREGLAEQVAFAARHFELVAGEHLRDVAEAGRGRYVAFTFDDGYRDSYDVALPLLREHAAPATFFVATGFIDRPRLAWWDEIAWIIASSRRDELDLRPWVACTLALDDPGRAVTALTLTYKTLPGKSAAAFLEALAAAAGTGRAPAGLAGETWMTWKMVRALRSAGMSLGAHSVTHPVLSRLPLAAQRREVEGSLRRLAEEVGERPRTFSYPVGLRGSFDARTRRALVEAGVTCALSYYGGWQPAGRLDPLDVPRVVLAKDMSARAVRALLDLPRVFAREVPTTVREATVAARGAAADGAQAGGSPATRRR